MVIVWLLYVCYRVIVCLLYVCYRVIVCLLYGCCMLVFVWLLNVVVWLLYNEHEKPSKEKSSFSNILDL
jgi:hypothetical protein